MPDDDHRYRFLQREEAALLLIDHQVGTMLFGISDLDIVNLLNNTMKLVEGAEVFELPIILTTSNPTAVNGPLFTELTDAPPAVSPAAFASAETTASGVMRQPAPSAASVAPNPAPSSIRLTIASISRLPRTESSLRRRPLVRGGATLTIPGSAGDAPGNRGLRVKLGPRQAVASARLGGAVPGQLCREIRRELGSSIQR
ncbi:MAG: hypothetical protein WAL63_17180 [Solirubrobacteraceae bacterium]